MEINMLIEQCKLAQLQKRQTDMLKAFIEVCHKLDLKYYLIGGTLLGAVRHKGFIPWDDDIDVAMPRHDYMIMMREGVKLFQKPYFLQTYESEPLTPYTWMKLRDGESTYIEYTTRNLPMNQGIWLDIFPLDFCSRGKMHMTILKYKRHFAEMRIDDSLVLSKVQRKPLVKAVRYFLKSVARTCFPTVQSAVFYIDMAYQSIKTGDQYTVYGTIAEKHVFPAEWFGEGNQLEFENLMTVVPSAWDKVLRELYGDYMKLPPEDKRKPGHNVYVIDLDKPYTEYDSDVLT